MNNKKVKAIWSWQVDYIFSLAETKLFFKPRINLKFKPAYVHKNILKRWIVCLEIGLDIQLNFKVMRIWGFQWGLHVADARLPSPDENVHNKKFASFLL